MSRIVDVRQQSNFAKPYSDCWRLTHLCVVAARLILLLLHSSFFGLPRQTAFSLPPVTHTDPQKLGFAFTG